MDSVESLQRAWGLVSKIFQGARGRGSVFQHEVLCRNILGRFQGSSPLEEDVAESPRQGLWPWDQAAGLQLDNHSKAGEFSAGELETFGILSKSWPMPASPAHLPSPCFWFTALQVHWSAFLP